MCTAIDYSIGRKKQAWAENSENSSTREETAGDGGQDSAADQKYLVEKLSRCMQTDGLDASTLNNRSDAGKADLLKTSAIKFLGLSPLSNVMVVNSADDVKKEKLCSELCDHGAATMEDAIEDKNERNHVIDMPAKQLPVVEYSKQCPIDMGAKQLQVEEYTGQCLDLSIAKKEQVFPTKRQPKMTSTLSRPTPPNLNTPYTMLTSETTLAVKRIKDQQFRRESGLPSVAKSVASSDKSPINYAIKPNYSSTKYPFARLSGIKLRDNTTIKSTESQKPKPQFRSPERKFDFASPSTVHRSVLTSPIPNMPQMPRFDGPRCPENVAMLPSFHKGKIPGVPPTLQFATKADIHKPPTLGETPLCDCSENDSHCPAKPACEQE